MLLRELLAESTVTEKKKRKRKSRHAAYGPGPYGMYGYYGGYSGDSSGGDGGGESIEYENFTDSKVNEILDNPAPYTWSKDEFGFPTATSKDLGLHIAFDGRNDPMWEVSFYREQEDGDMAMNYATGQGKEFQVFATVKAAIDDFMRTHKDTNALVLDARKDSGKGGEGRVRLYRRLMRQYANTLGWRYEEADQGSLVSFEILKPRTNENFADGKNPQDKGDSKRHGVPTKASVSTLRNVAKQGGRKGQLAHWMANMKAGKAKKNETLTEAVIHPSTMDALQDFLPFVMKLLKLDKLPRISVHKTINTGDQPSFGGYNPTDGTIQLALKDRHPADVLRTLAHELVHFKQDQQGELDENSGATGSNEENEANTKAGIIMRHFNKRFPQYLE